MRYIMKQALMSWGDDFAVRDERGKEYFYFDGKSGTIRKTIHVLGPSRARVATIQKHLISYRPTFSIADGPNQIATVYKKLLSFRPSFVIDVPGPDDITVVGKMFEHDYRFYKREEEIAQISKRWFTAKDTYGIEVHDTEDSLLILSAAVIIDLILHPKRDSTF